MVAVATHSPARERHQQHVHALLEEIDRRRQHLYVLRAAGARPAGVRDLKAELHGVRDELAAAVGAAAISR